MPKEILEPFLEIKKIYLKDASFESSCSLGVFNQNISAEPNVEFNIKCNDLGTNTYEVILAITIRVNSKQKNIFLIEVQQAGLFMLHNFPQQDVEQLLETYCVNTIFPYARETISSLTLKGGFQPFILDPIDFNNLYLQKKQQLNVTKH